jgi:hypothetical protein
MYITPYFSYILLLKLLSKFLADYHGPELSVSYSYPVLAIGFYEPFIFSTLIYLRRTKVCILQDLLYLHLQYHSTFKIIPFFVFLLYSNLFLLIFLYIFILLLFRIFIKIYL